MTTQPEAGWYADPHQSNRQRYWDGQAWTEHTAQNAPTPNPVVAPPPQVVIQERVVRPAKAAHGVGYWITVGWFIGPLKWVGRVLLWVLLLPVGIWRSIANSKKKDRRRQARGT